MVVVTRSSSASSLLALNRTLKFNTLLSTDNIATKGVDKSRGSTVQGSPVKVEHTILEWIL